MKLIQISDRTWINPDGVESVTIGFPRNPRESFDVLPPAEPRFLIRMKTGVTWRATRWENQDIQLLLGQLMGEQL